MRRVFWALLAVAAAVIGLVVVVVVATIASPALDNWCGALSGRALRTVQEHREQGRTIRDIVDATYRDPEWRAYHRDELSDTYVRCTATRPDGSPVVLQWFVRFRFRFLKSPHIENEVVTAINQDAAQVAPSLVKPGQVLYGSPDIAY